jgi:3-keto-5-aminohexanoate cleavage enzyme
MPENRAAPHGTTLFACFCPPRGRLAEAAARGTPEYTKRNAKPKAGCLYRNARFLRGKSLAMHLLKRAPLCYNNLDGYYTVSARGRRAMRRTVHGDAARVGGGGKGRENEMEKLIVTAAICGAEVTKEHNPAVPYTVAEIVREAKSARDAGASVIHLHVREDDGRPTQSKERFQLCTDAIRKACGDVIIQPSTGGAVGMSDTERLQSTEITPTPEFATLDCGTLNFGGDEIFVNSDNTIFNFARTMKERGIKPELEVFDKGMIDIAMKADGKGLLVRPLHFDFVLGVQMTATVRDLSFMVGSIPQGSTWTVAGIGRHAFEMAAAGIIMGGHVRVGFEDNLYLEKGLLAQSNGALVEKVVRLAKLLGREIASPAEARGILRL